MNDLTVRRIEMCVRVVSFLASNRIVFSKGSQGPQLVKRLTDKVDDIKRLAAAQVSGLSSARTESATRVAARSALVDAMGRIDRCARGMAVTMPELNDKFRVGDKTGDSILLSRAHAFASDAVSFREAFARFEMAPKFIDDLNARIKALEDAIDDHTISKGGHVATTGLLDEEMGNVMVTIAQLDPIVENKLEGNPMLLTRWEHARHIERAWANKPDPEPNPTPAPAHSDTSAAA
jgi:hypothetical protein